MLLKKESGSYVVAGTQYRRISIGNSVWDMKEIEK